MDTSKYHMINPGEKRLSSRSYVENQEESSPCPANPRKRPTFCSPAQSALSSPRSRPDRLTLGGHCYVYHRDAQTNQANWQIPIKST